MGVVSACGDSGAVGVSHVRGVVSTRSDSGGRHIGVPTSPTSSSVMTLRSGSGGVRVVPATG